jgi:hypothetical protein
MVAFAALKNVNARLVENGTLSQTSAQHALYGLRLPVYGICHIVFPRKSTNDLGGKMWTGKTIKRSAGCQLV